MFASCSSNHPSRLRARSPYSSAEAYSGLPSADCDVNAHQPQPQPQQAKCGEEGPRGGGHESRCFVGWSATKTTRGPMLFRGPCTRSPEEDNICGFGPGATALRPGGQPRLWRLWRRRRRPPALNNNTPSCLLYTSPSPRDLSTSRMPSSA